MAVTATTIHEVESGGSDTANSGGFDPAATFATDGAVSSANTSAPVLTSASYTFVAGDVGAWVFIKSGTNSIPGWYKIASVAGGAATLNATAGQAVLYPSLQPSTATGCGTAASLTTQTWGVDYSQQAAAQVTYTDLVIGATTTQLTSAAHPFGQNSIGNVINVTGGTGFTVQRLVISSVSGTTATCNASAGTAASTAGTGNLGGAYATPGGAGAGHVGGNVIYIKGSSTYLQTSVSNNVAGGCLNMAAGSATAHTKVIGYGSVRGDGPTGSTRPLLQASGISTGNILQMAGCCYAEGLQLDGANLTSIRGINGANGTRAFRVLAKRMTLQGFASVSNCVLCEATGCSNVCFSSCNCFGCAAYANTTNGFQGCTCFDCIACNNTSGANGFASAGGNDQWSNCVAYNNAAAGFAFSTSGTAALVAVNCVSVGNGTYGFQAASTMDGAYLYNCAAFGNTTAATTNIPAGNQYGFVTLTGSPFNNAAGNDFSLNGTAGAGAACRAAGVLGAFPGLSTTSFQDLGAAQHQATGGGVVPVGMGGGFHG